MKYRPYFVKYRTCFNEKIQLSILFYGYSMMSLRQLLDSFWTVCRLLLGSL